MLFFASRRRHTRLQGDWSSGVCSSDLVSVLIAGAAAVGAAGRPGIAGFAAEGAGALGADAGGAVAATWSPAEGFGLRFTSGAGGRSCIQKYTTVPTANTPRAPIVMRNGRRGLGYRNLAS